MKSLRLFCAILICLISYSGSAQQSDNEDGTFTNPVIWSDFPDNDVIRVGDTYYMVTTTMYFFPGVTVLKSKDLVNWEYCANAIERFDQHPFYNMEGGTRYAHGQWASSIRYHKGIFHILFVTLDEGGFHLTAEKAEGPWTLKKLPKAYYDAGLFYDEDGRVYIAHGYSKISLTEVDENLSPLTRDSIIFDKVQRPGLEGSHVYKINGYYYIYATYGGGDGYQVALRSKNIFGPYEEKVLLRDDMNVSGKGIHQGALIEAQSGEWWSIIFQDRDGVGRVPTLQPVTWKDGWPMLGENGRAVVTYKKPNVGKVWPVTKLPVSDEFNDDKLGMQWAWNHNPDESKWSLTERKGFLRLKTCTVTDNLTLARNTLTQRMFGPYSVSTVSLVVDQMKEGDVAGLGVIQMPYAYIAVKAENGSKSVVMVHDGTVRGTIPFGTGQNIYLRASANTMQDIVTFSCSKDNKIFVPLGDTLHMMFNLKMFTGNRFSIFNYATSSLGGYVDIDWFRMDTRQDPPNHFKASSRIEAEMYDEIAQAKVAACRDSANVKDQSITHTVDGAWFKFNHVDFGAGYKYLMLRVAAQQDGGKINIYLDDAVSPYVTIAVTATGGRDKYKAIRVPVKSVKGIHRLTWKFNASVEQQPFINWFSFTNK